MRTSLFFVRPAAALVLTICASATASAAGRIGPLAAKRAAAGVGWSRVIIRATTGATLPDLVPVIQQAGGSSGRALPIIHAMAAFLPDSALAGLANNPNVEEISFDRRVAGAMERTGATIGATAIRQALGYDGSGVTIAIIDSGVTAWHDDLGDGSGGQRVDRFVDFVDGRTTPYDDYGHGTHVAGIVAGSGFDSGGARSGIAPGAHLVILKVLDATGTGRISDVIAALDYIVANKDTLNIRIANLSVAAGVFESYNTDPLTLAARRAVEAGIVVVAAAGNAGRDPRARTMYGGITAPANAPWVLTVGASSHMGTIDRSDDTIAEFSSRGPTAVDFTAKPDILAPGVGIESLSDPDATLYTSFSPYLLDGTLPTPYRPYLSLSGTSMAAPVVTGTVALMLQANPALTPNAVKAILQYSAHPYAGYDALTQGAGFLNAQGAIDLALFFASPGDHYPPSRGAGTRLVWGNRSLQGGRLMPDANAWSLDVTWGDPTSNDGHAITWGTICADSTCEASDAWQTTCADAACSSVTWDAAGAHNIVWGSLCGGADCAGAWTLADAGSSVSGSDDGDTVVWGSSDGDTVVWGSSDGDTVVWGSSDGDTVVWGSSCPVAICQPVLWPRQ